MTQLNVERAMLRSLSAAALALGALSCDAPSVEHTEPTPVVTAVFDPTTSKVPLPNDLVFFNPVNSVCPPPANESSGPPACAQAELLASFAGAFPSDQELAVTIDFTETTFVNGKATQSAPDLDLTTFVTPNVFVFGSIAGGPPGPIPLDPPSDADYVKADDHGTLTLHHQGRTPWPTGSYSLVVHGGPNGVKTKDGLPVYASQVFALIEQGLDMTDPKNLGLLKAQLGSTAAAIEQGKQLNLLIALYKPTVFATADTQFPHQDLAIATTFKIAPTVTNVEVDPARGLAPLPFDLLRDPKTGKLSALAACTLAGSSLAADGKSCASASATAAAAGFRTLDGFSTTGAILAPTSELIKVSTVTPSSLLLYDLSDPASPVQVDPAGLILEPCEFTSACGSPTALSPVIAIQPAGATAGDPTSVFRTRPLKDNTDYAVVMTTAIHDKADNPIGAGTVAKVLKFQNPVFVGGQSALQGIDDTTASSLENMRLQLQPVLKVLAKAGIDSSKVATAYTFHTQTILSPAVQLAALPYITPAATALPGPVTAETPAAAFTKFGVALPSSNIDEILETDITTFNALDPKSGAFLPDPTQAAPEQIHVLVATPKVTNTNIPACPAALGPLKCAPVVIFRHGLGRGRADMLLIADSFAAAGMVTMAIDAAKHGDRALCSSGAGAASGCLGTCTAIPGAAGQGDPSPPGPPGTCDAAGLVKDPVTPGATGNTDGIPKASGNYLVTANFFRTRDTLRQDLIDQSQLIRALVFAPSGLPPTGHSVFDHMAPRGVIIDPLPGSIYYAGQSLGAIQGAVDVAANPRIAKAGLNVGGGTIVDLFTNSPAFAPAVNQLLAGLGIQRGTSQFLQFLVVAKTVLDPADPINFVGHLTDIKTTLPNLLPPLGGNPNGTVPQLPKKILTQVANCESVVPNPFGLLYASNVGTSPLPPAAFLPGSTGTFQLFVGAGFNPVDFGNPAKCSASTAVGHGFLTDFANPALTLTAQGDLAGFVRFDTLPPSVRQ